MSSFIKIKGEFSVLSYFLLFLGVATIMFGFFFTAMARPRCKLKNRMQNTEVPWTQIRENIVKINYGDCPERVKELIGEPDEKFVTVTKTIYSYQKYGLYKPTFFYEIEFRKDTLHHIDAHD